MLGFVVTHLGVGAKEDSRPSHGEKHFSHSKAREPCVVWAKCDTQSDVNNVRMTCHFSNILVKLRDRVMVNHLLPRPFPISSLAPALLFNSFLGISMPHLLIVLC